MNRFLFLLLSVPALLVAEVDPNMSLQGIVVDLREPIFVDGVLTTDQGGVLQAPELRIQAQKIRYTRKVLEGEPVFRVEAEGDLMLEYQGRTFIGDALTYDFRSSTGTLSAARTGIGIWFLGGDQVDFLGDGSFRIQNASVTTCDNIKTDWQIQSDEVIVTEDNLLSARNVKFMYVKIPLFWLPVYKTDLEDISDTPISYRIGYGGHQGLQLRARYRAWSWRNWQAFLRLDYLTRRGLGAGLETRYEAPDGSASFFTRNYVANDFNPLDPSLSTRYRVEGFGHIDQLLDHYDITFHWDKLSDRDMASDYADRDFNYLTPELTHVTVRREDADWIGTVVSQVRLNTFQTVRQVTPRLTVDLRPLELGETGIINETRAEAGYLAYKFDKDILGAADFDSSRTRLQSKVYRPIPLGPVNVIPEAGYTGIHYSNSPQSKGRYQQIFVGQVEANTIISKQTERSNQVIKPYAQYRYYTSPTAAPTEVHIFDLTDGWSKVNMMTLGNEYTLLHKHGDQPDRVLVVNAWTNAFLKNKSKVSNPIPRVYSSVTWNITPSISHYAQTAWDTARNKLDHFNWRTEWTVSEDLAIASEFRHRSDYSWRKVDYDNFNIDFFRSEGELLDSTLSDRRNTVLFHYFQRFSPTVSLEMESRHGWRRKDEPDYHEFDVDLTTLVRCKWECTFSYQHRESDERFSFNIALRDALPKRENLYSSAWYR